MTPTVSRATLSLTLLAACSHAQQPAPPPPWCSQYAQAEGTSGAAGALKRMDLVYEARQWKELPCGPQGPARDGMQARADLDVEVLVLERQEDPWALRLAGWWFAVKGEWGRSAEARCAAARLDDQWVTHVNCGLSQARTGDRAAAVESWRAAYWQAGNKQERYSALALIEDASADPDADFQGIPATVIQQWRQAREDERVRQQAVEAQAADAARVRQEVEGLKEIDAARARRQRQVCEAQCEGQGQLCRNHGGDYTGCSRDESACKTTCSGY